MVASKTTDGAQESSINWREWRGDPHLGSLCCVGPLLVVTLGVGAGLASALEPLRPAFGVVMLALFAVGFWTVYGRRIAAHPKHQSVVATGADVTDGTCGAACVPAVACAVSPTRM